MQKTSAKLNLIKKTQNNIYNTSEIDFINVFCLDGNVNRVLVSLSNGVSVELLANDEDVR